MLTEQEEAEFTFLNFMAFDTAMSQCKKKGYENVPCWLCMSQEAKDEYRKEVKSGLDKVLDTIIPLDDERTERLLKTQFRERLEDSFKRWKNAEILLKQHREEGNPKAFFIGIG